MRWHPTDVTLLEYAAGVLSECPRAVLAAHLSVCVRCRAIVAAGEAMGGVLLEEIPPALLSPTLRRRVSAWRNGGPQTNKTAGLDVGSRT
jgi:putative transcriptional regulator